ncbi:molybdopterin-synthase adenylyltransferase MoeB [Synoicihabitans lomoniglobus]|uniref:Molybdopterin-synthase adenylyltransferase n=1 Tax=Synoicihabitans lomoniglobus TaxID=2909285 RepID=A0AAF0I469_9BACT|nr:molybdopterin-synthase adenylyltransferase MoeB [Opitutaceae bacterium LMO-M01]WED66315.1 molybdopterin-synthase adenylyltransferase MoeB [Opitutaceae bacterium LMO-M01]
MQPLNPVELARYSRHVLLPEIGVEGQTKLKAARVLIIGAGGLGSPAALYLAAAGVGTIGIADFDQVEASNLHRQLLHRDATIGQPKVTSAAHRLRETNPHIEICPHPEGVTPDNVNALFEAYDVIVDGTDNFGARYLNNDAAARARRPLVFGSVYRFEGQVTVFAPHLGGPCYRCLFPEPPPSGSVPGCGEVGVLGALCGVIGSWQALEAIKLITGCGEPLLGRLMVYDALGPAVNTLPFPAVDDCPGCAGKTTLTAETCEAASDSLSMSDTDYPLEVSVAEAQALLEANDRPARMIDVREPHEFAICSVSGADQIPMRQIPENVGELPRDQHLLIMCHHGGRSMRVTEYLRAQGFTAVTNVAGGIDAWATTIEPGMLRY